MTSLSALAARSSSVGSTNISAPELLLQMVIGLGVVLAIIALSARLLRRGRGHSASRSQRREGTIRVLGRQPLGKGVSIAVVQVGERAYLLGITPTTVRRIGETDAQCLPKSETTTSRFGAGTGTTQELFTWGKSNTNSAMGLELASHKGPKAQRSESTWTSAIEHLRELTLRRG